jgi:hypothetical protein
MRKKMLLLTLALAATAASLAAPRAQAIGGGGPYHSCPMCTTLPNGAQCCISCLCNAAGVPMICAENACVPAGDIG